MWDNRNELNHDRYNHASDSDKAACYDLWYKTKTTSNNVEYPDGELEALTPVLSGLTPILQLEPLKGYDKIDKSNALIFHLPSQVYFAPAKREKIKDNINPGNRLYFNETMWKFNRDYLNSIQILNPRFLLVRTIENLYNFIMGRASTIDVSINKVLIENKIKQVIRKFVVTEDRKIEDCFFEFSNEDFDEAIRIVENDRRAIHTNQSTISKKSENIDDLLNPVLNGKQAGTETTFGILSSKIISNRAVNASSSDDNRNLRTATDRSSGEQMETYSYDERLNLEITMDSDHLLEDLIMAIVMPFVESIFTPQVMLYVMINMKVLGLIDEDSLKDVNNAFDSPIMRFIIVKQLSIIKSLINFVTDLILQIMLNLAIKTLTVTIYRWIGITTLEKINDWLALLTSAYKCLPTFKISRKTIKDGPDDIVYADIIDNGEELDQPESTNKC
jgi:hypothetical protein